MTPQPPRTSSTTLRTVLPLACLTLAAGLFLFNVRLQGAVRASEHRIADLEARLVLHQRHVASVLQAAQNQILLLHALNDRFRAACAFRGGAASVGVRAYEPCLEVDSREVTL